MVIELRKVEKVPTKSIFENSLTFQAPSLLKRTWKIPVIWPHLHCVESVQIWSIFCTAFSLIRTEYGDLLRSFSYSDWIRKFTPRKYGPEKTPYLDIFHTVLVLTQLTLLNRLPWRWVKFGFMGFFRNKKKDFLTSSNDVKIFWTSRKWKSFTLWPRTIILSFVQIEWGVLHLPPLKECSLLYYIFETCSSSTLHTRAQFSKCSRVPTWENYLFLLF